MKIDKNKSIIKLEGEDDKMEKENVLQKNMCDYSKGIEIMQIILICASALLVPTFLAKLLNMVFGANSFIASHSQIIVGTIVNIALITSALNVKGWKKIVRNNYFAKYINNTWRVCI